MTAPGTGGPAEDAQMRRAVRRAAWLNRDAHGGIRFEEKDSWRKGYQYGIDVALDAALSAAAGSVPEDGGEALRREVERLCDLAMSGEYVAFQPFVFDLRTAAAAVRERREERLHEFTPSGGPAPKHAPWCWCQNYLAAPVGGRSQDEQERP